MTHSLKWMSHISASLKEYDSFMTHSCVGRHATHSCVWRWTYLVSLWLHFLARARARTCSVIIYVFLYLTTSLPPSFPPSLTHSLTPSLLSHAHALSLSRCLSVVHAHSLSCARFLFPISSKLTLLNQIQINDIGKPESLTLCVSETHTLHVTSWHLRHTHSETHTSETHALRDTYTSETHTSETHISQTHMWDTHTWRHTHTVTLPWHITYSVTSATHTLCVSEVHTLRDTRIWDTHTWRHTHTVTCETHTLPNTRIRDTHTAKLCDISHTPRHLRHSLSLSLSLTHTHILCIQDTHTPWHRRHTHSVHRVAKTHKMSYLYRSFCAKEPYKYWLF